MKAVLKAVGIVAVVFMFAFLIAKASKPIPSSEETKGKRLNNIVEKLPERAENIEMLGNSWCYFELDGKKFLHRRYSGASGYAYECVTWVPREEK